MKSGLSRFVVLLGLLHITNSLLAQQLKTFAEIPGRTSSDKYRFRVRMVGSKDWKDAFVLQTISKPEIRENGQNISGYKENLLNWTASWISFGFSGTTVEVEISKVGGAPIAKAMVRPVGHTSAAKIIDGKVYVTFEKPANVNVDIDGQMEDRYTGMGYSGPPVHTISLFANPVLKANFELASNADLIPEIPFIIYPNPASGKLQVNFANPGVKKIQFVDLTGRVVYTSCEVGQNETIDLNGMISGLYFVQIHTGADIFKTKVIIK